MHANLPDDVREYLLDMLTALGQMNHIATRVACEHMKSKSHVVPHNGIMTMSVDVRRKIIADGWKLLEKTSGHNE